MATKLAGKLTRESNTVIIDRGHKRLVLIDLIAGNDLSSDVIRLRPKGTQFDLEITVGQLWGILETRFAKGKL